MAIRWDYKRAVVAVYILGLSLQYMDATIVNVAIPTLARQFQVNSGVISWVVTGYLLSLAIFIPVSGWLGDRYGTKRTYLFALFMFTLGSALCSAAWNADSLILFRFIQGMGGGLLAPVGTAMMYRAFPAHERARMAGLAAIPITVAPTLGPIIGGYFVQYANWSWIFTINIPIGFAGLVFAAVGLKEHVEDASGKLDVPGFILGGLGLFGLLYALQEVGTKGIYDPSVYLTGAGGLITTVWFVWHELHVIHPMIDVRLYRDELFRAGNVVLLFNQAIFSSGIYLLPFFLQIGKGLSPFESGLTTFPIALGVAMVTPLAGRLYPRIGPRKLLMSGMILGALASFVFLSIDFTTNSWWIRALMLPRGWAFGVATVALLAATFASIGPSLMGRASAAYSVVNQIGASLGVAVTTTVLSSRLVVHGAILGDPFTQSRELAAFHDTFVASGLIGVIGTAAAWFVSDRLAARSIPRDPVGVARDGTLND